MTSVNLTIQGIPEVRNVVWPEDLTVAQPKGGGVEVEVVVGDVRNQGNVTETISAVIDNLVACTPVSLQFKNLATNQLSSDTVELAPNEKAKIFAKVLTDELEVGDPNTPCGFSVTPQ